MPEKFPIASLGCLANFLCLSAVADFEQRKFARPLRLRTNGNFSRLAVMKELKRRASKNSDKAAAVKTVQNSVVRSPDFLVGTSIGISLGFTGGGFRIFCRERFFGTFFKKSTANGKNQVNFNSGKKNVFLKKLFVFIKIIIFNISHKILFFLTFWS